MDVSLRTNVEMAQGWAQRRQFTGDIMHPALRLVRIAQALKPRDWGERWEAAYSKVGGAGALPREWVALSTSPIWVALSRFGNPYPPFDYNSSMWVEPVSLDEAIALGLITPDNEDAVRDEVANTPLPSLNEDVACAPKISEQGLRNALAEALQGLAKWEGDTLRLTDPNGTRAYKHDEIGSVITAALPHGIPNLQAEAFKLWIRDDNKFKSESDSAKPATLNQREDLARLFNRIEPVADDGLVYRGLKTAGVAQQTELLEQFETHGYSARPEALAESWSSSPRIGDKYAGKNGCGIILRSSSYSSRKRLDSLYSTAGSDYIQETPYHPKQAEAESVFMRGVRFKVVGKEQRGGNIYLDVEEERN